MPALQAFKSSEMWEELFGCLEDFARLLRDEGDVDATVRVLAAMAAARQRVRLIRPPRAARELQSMIDDLRQTLGTERFDSAWSDGAMWDVEDAIRAAVGESEARVPA